MPYLQKGYGMMVLMKELLEKHPYGDLMEAGRQILILGSFPIGKFTNPLRRSEIKENEIDFYYGGAGNGLWKILSQVFGEELKTKEQIASFLKKQKIAMADVIQACCRKDGSALDQDLFDIQWNKSLKEKIQKYQIEKIFFTSQWVKKQFVKNIFPDFKGEGIILLSPSQAAQRGIPRIAEYKELLKTEPKLTVGEYRLRRYQKDFLKLVKR